MRFRIVSRLLPVGLILSAGLAAGYAQDMSSPDIDAMTRPVAPTRVSTRAAAASAQDPSTDLSQVSLEGLTQMRISVSSFARKEEDLWKTPAAVYVISREDIAHSSATSVPELLRVVPGMQVAQIDASHWAVSARGFNSAYADKLLVLVDGRTVYSEIYSGVPWDQVDLPLEDIERIEVIRGPGAAVWGTNAVNGVVNIITRRAHSTLGPHVTAHIGRINDTLDLRYGGTLGYRAQYRGFLSFVNREPLENRNGSPAYDGEKMIRGGGRVDWQKSWADWITVTGDLYGGRLEAQTLNEIAVPIGPNGGDKESIGGGYLLSRWEHKRADGDSALQFYYDDQSRKELSSEDRTRTADIYFQDHRAANRRNDLVWGAEYRFTADTIHGPVQVTMKPVYHNYLIDGFLQDEIALVPNRLIATLGTKIQDGTLAGFEVQPSARLLWAITPQQSLWTAVSRAAVAPAVQQKGLNLPLDLGTYQGIPLTGTVEGSAAFKDEEVVAYEAGYRRRLGPHLSLDLAGFVNRYRRIQSLTLNPMFVLQPYPQIYTQFVYSNAYRARGEGGEAALSFKPSPAFSLAANYSWMQSDSRQVVPGNQTQVDLWSTPRNTLAATAFWAFRPQWSANAFVYSVGPLATENSFVSGGNDPEAAVHGYTRVDLHLSRRFGSNLKFDGGVSNLLDPRHLEFGNGTDFVVPEYVPRSFYLNAGWSF